MVVYVASRLPLPLIAWQQDAPAFNVTELTEPEKPVLRLLTLPHVRQAGSHTGCGCGFNEGRDCPEAFDESAAERAHAVESSKQLARYIRDNQVEQIYGCWSGDESESKQSERHITADDLAAPEFFFKQRELLFIDHVG